MHLWLVNRGRHTTMIVSRPRMARILTNKNIRVVRVIRAIRGLIIKKQLTEVSCLKQKLNA